MVNWSIFKGSEQDWNGKLITLPFYSIYQSHQWGEIKKEDGWNLVRFISDNSMAQVLYKKLPCGGGFFWCPGGILGDKNNLDLNRFKKELGISFFYFRCSFHQPDLNLAHIHSLGWKKSAYSINGNQSMAIGISRNENDILNNMSSNWRHNLKRFEKKQIEVSYWLNPEPEVLFGYYEKFENFKGLSQQHSFASIKGVIEKFKGHLVILRALDQEGDLLALRGYIFLGERALDWYAISTEQGRSCYASYGVLWSMLKDAKSRGVITYDLSGVDPVNNAGVFNFKKGTGAELVEYPGEFEVSSIPMLSMGMNFIMKKKLST